MTVKQYQAFKRFHKRSVRLRGWWDAQDKISPLLALLVVALLFALLFHNKYVI